MGNKLFIPLLIQATNQRMPGLSIKTQPVNFSGIAGQQLTISVGAPVAVLFSFYKVVTGGNDLLVGQNPTGDYIVMQSALQDAGQYYCIVADAAGKTIKSDTVTVLITNPELKITVQPQPFTGEVGDSLQIKVVAPNGTLFKFYKGSQLIGQNTTGIYEVQAAALTDSGDYYCIVSDDYDQTLKSNTVTVAISQPDTGGGDNGGGEEPESPETAATFITGKLRTVEGQNGVYYDQNDPAKFTNANKNEAIVITNSPKDGVYIMAGNVQQNWQGSGKNITTLRQNLDNEYGGPSDLQQATDMVYKLSHSPSSGEDTKGDNLTWYGGDTYVFDPNSPANIVKAEGALLKLYHSLSGRTTVDTVYCSEAKVNYGVNVMQLVGDVQVPGLYGCKWALTDLMPHDAPAVNTAFTGSVSVMIIGDSNSAFAGDTLFKILKAALPNATIRVENRAVGGSGVNTWAPNTDLLNAAIASAQTNGYDIINLNLGTNNVELDPITPAVYKTKMQAIIDELRSKLTLKGLVVQGVFSPINNNLVAQFNAQIPTLSNITVGTFRPIELLAQYPQHMKPDNLHFYKPGYTLVNEQWAKTIIPIAIAG